MEDEPEDLDGWILKNYPSKSDYQKVDKLKMHFLDTLFVIDRATKCISIIYLFLGENSAVSSSFIYNNTTTSKYYNDTSRTSSNMYKQLINYYLFDKLIRARNIER